MRIFNQHTLSSKAQLLQLPNTSLNGPRMFWLPPTVDSSKKQAAIEALICNDILPLVRDIQLSSIRAFDSSNRQVLQPNSLPEK
jgi:hypothetical protein